MICTACIALHINEQYHRHSIISIHPTHEHRSIYVWLEQGNIVQTVNSSTALVAANFKPSLPYINIPIYVYIYKYTVYTSHIMTISQKSWMRLPTLKGGLWAILHPEQPSHHSTPQTAPSWKWVGALCKRFPIKNNHHWPRGVSVSWVLRCALTWKPS